MFTDGWSFDIVIHLIGKHEVEQCFLWGYGYRGRKRN